MNRLAAEKLKTQLDPIARPAKLGRESVRRAAVVLFLDFLEDQVLLLLIRRAVRANDPWSGQMAFPGGRMSCRDGCLEDTLIREVQEEVGVNIHDRDLLGTMSDVRSTRRPVLVTPYIVLLKRRVTLALNRDEVADATWVSVSDLARCKIVRRQVRTSEGWREADGIEYDGHFIWGMTLRMINDLFSRLRIAYECSGKM